MDTIIIPQQATGFPLVIETLEFLNKMVQDPFSALGHLVGQTTILKGVEREGVLGNYTFTDGFITYNGELLPFVGGASHNLVSIIEIVENVDYNIDIDNNEEFDNLPAYLKKYALLGESPDAVETFSFGSLKRHSTLDKHLVSLHEGSVYIGDIVGVGQSLDALVLDILFTEVPHTKYEVLGNFTLSNDEPIADDDLQWSIRNKTKTGFQLVLKQQNTDFTGVLFEYHLVSTAQSLTFLTVAG